MSDQDSRAVQALKKLLPQDAKDSAERAIRSAATATSSLRAAPDFLIIGTKRGGTTSLWNAVASHPQVLPMVPASKHIKSPHYFYWHFDRGPSWYIGHFPSKARRSLHAGLHGNAITGEASPMYLFDPRVPQRVATLLPRVKIVVTLRDPVQRALSHWKERVKEGVEDLSFVDALAAEPDRLAGELERMSNDPAYYSRPFDWYSYRLRGEYADQLTRWFEHVDRDRILVVRAEDMYDDQEGTLLQVQQFLGLTPHTGPQVWRNRTPVTEIPHATHDDLLNHFEPHNRRLADLLGTENWWPSASTTSTSRRIP